MGRRVLQGRPTLLKQSRERGKTRFTTYAKGARGAKRLIGTILVEDGDVSKALSDPANLQILGLTRPQS
jgi:hypothetical protein